MKKTILLFVGLLWLQILVHSQVTLYTKHELSEDLDSLYSIIQNVHLNMFENVQKDEFEENIRKAKSQLNDSMNRIEFYKIVAPLVVSIQDGHTSLIYPREDLYFLGPKLFPYIVNVNWHDTSVIIKEDRAFAKTEIPIGSRIISINNIPIKYIIANMYNFISGEKTFFKASNLQNSFTSLYYILYSQTEFNIEYEFNGKKQTSIIEGISYDQRYQTNTAQQNSVDSRYFSLSILPDSSIAILKINYFLDDGHWATFVDSTFNVIKNLKIKDLIIDIRNNGGGFSVLGDYLLQYISAVNFRQFGKVVTLPPDFYNDLLNEYEINSFKDCQTRYAIDYISNLVTVFEENDANVDKRINFYGTLNQFSSNELELLIQVYNGSDEAINSKEYKQFRQHYGGLKIMELSCRFNVHNLLQNVSKLNPCLGRDLIVSQSVAQNYFRNNHTPTQAEWDEIAKVISNKSVIEYLKEYSNESATTPDQKIPDTSTIKTSTDQVKAKYIDKYLGKVVYIDFYATWCSPCRSEIPHAKALYAEFKSEDVVFLNLCAQSKKEDWEKLIKQKGIEGENYLLSNEEFNLLSKLYNVNGFPTYLLIDRTGQLVNSEAPRPSTKQAIINEINKLL